ncbi:hypothetical protein WG628_16440 [Stenotrophomonas maltophilia]
MPFAKRGDVVHSEATSGFNNQKKSLLINGLAALGDSHRPLHVSRGLRPVLALRTRRAVPQHGLPEDSHSPDQTGPSTHTCPARAVADAWVRPGFPAAAVHSSLPKMERDVVRKVVLVLIVSAVLALTGCSGIPIC